MSNLVYLPLYHRVLVRRETVDELSAGGIVIPDTAKEKPDRGEIVEVGTGRLNADGTITPLILEVGDKVVFSKYAGTEVCFSGDKDLILLSEDDILAVVFEEDEELYEEELGEEELDEEDVEEVDVEEVEEETE